MLLTQKGAESRAKPLFRTTTKSLHLLVQLLDVEAGHQPLGEFADMFDTGRQVLPFISLEKRELGGHVDRYVGTAEVEMSDHGCKRIDVGRKHVRFARECVAKAALARLYLTD